MNPTTSKEQLPSVSFDLSTLEEAAPQFSNRSVKPQAGLSFWRILQPFGTNHKNALSHEYSLHWGFVGPSGKKTPVSCSYPTEGYCPVCAKVFEARDELKRAEANGNEALIEELTKYVSENGRKKSFVYNAITPDGRVVMLEVGKMAHDDLKKRIGEAVHVKKFDPTSLDNGVWFQIERTGSGYSTEYKVDFKKISVDVNGEMLEKLDRSPLAPELVVSLKAQFAGGAEGPAKDIHSLYDTRTAQELREFLSGGKMELKKRPSGMSPVPTASSHVPVDLPVGPKAEDVKSEIDRLRNLQKSKNA